MSRFLLVLLILATLLALSECARKRNGKGRRKKINTDRKNNRNDRKGNGKGNDKGNGKGNGKGKKVKTDACTAAGHPCMLGQECIVERYTKQERCICVEYCPEVPDAEVCGSDMKTYKTACHLYKMACDTHRMVFAAQAGPCDKYHTEHLKVEPEMAKACENSHTTFKCQHDKMVERISAWKKDGKVIKSGKKIVIQDNTLTVKWVMEADQGNYTCVTIDTNGTARMANASLMMTRVPYAKIPSNHITCEHGDGVMIPCEHSKDSQVSWMKNGFEIDEGDGVSMDDSGMLIMQQTEFDASGTYQCVASNFCGVSTAECSVNVTARDPNRCDEGVELLDCDQDPCEGMVCEGRPELTCKVSRCGECGYYWEDEEMMNVSCPVLEAPRIINTQVVSLTPEGEDAVIPCEATGYPKPTVTWSLDDGTSIEGMTKHSLRGDNTLVIRQLVLGLDNGRYKCVAENTQGRAEESIVIAILPRMTPMCPRTTDKIMTCHHDFCATAECPSYEDQMENVTCVNTVCNACTYIFVDRSNNYVDCYADPNIVKKMKNMNMGNMPWPATSAMAGSGSMGGGHGGMGGLPGGMGGMPGGMGAMPGWPAGSGSSSMGAMPGWPAGMAMGGSGSMGAMPGWPAGSGSSMGAMPGWPAGMAMGGSGSMAAMPGWPAGMAMAGSGSMGGGHGGAMSGGMGAMPGWPAGSGSSMGAMPGWPAGSSMGGSGSMGSMSSGMGGMSGMSGMGGMDKNAWHFVPGWPGHMSQMKNGTSSTKGSGSGDQAQQAGGGGGGHLNVFYSGKPEDEEGEEES